VYKRQALGAERFADIFVEQGQVDVLGVDFVYDDEARHVGPGGEFEQLSGVCFYAGGGRDDETSGFGGRNSFYGGSDEVRVAGRVDDVDGSAGVVSVDDSGGDGVLTVLFLVVVVADGSSIVDASEAACGAGFVEDSLSEGGFARAAVSEKDDVANIAGTGHFRISKRLNCYAFSSKNQILQ